MKQLPYVIDKNGDRFFYSHYADLGEEEGIRLFQALRTNANGYVVGLTLDGRRHVIAPERLSTVEVTTPRVLSEPTLAQSVA